MADNLHLTTLPDPTVLDSVSLYLYHTLVYIQRRHPEFINEKYRKLQWQDCQEKFINLATKELGKARSASALTRISEKILAIFLDTRFLKSPECQCLLDKIHQAADVETKETVLESSKTVEQSTGKIAILLLDAENLQLDIETEKFLAKNCRYPIQIKLAFANWRNMGKQDIELHKRGYELIHVPAGRDSADVKMATVGSSIFVHYPTAREVLVCSSDRVLTHLCNTLQTHGMLVYLVRKQGEKWTFLNTETGKVEVHRLRQLTVIPPLHEVINRLKQVIQQEQRSTSNQWVKLSKISTLFQEKCQYPISQVVSTHYPGRRARDIFLGHSNIFVVHQPTNESELYITLFENSVRNSSDSQKPNQQFGAEFSDPGKPGISSREELEEALAEIVNALTTDCSGSYVSLSSLGLEFRKHHGQAVTATIKSLEPGSNLPRFLNSCDSFKLKQTSQGYQVTLAEP